MQERELIGIDDEGKSLRLIWGDVVGWSLQRENGAHQWADIASYLEPLPVRALPFAQWLLQRSRLHWDIIEEAVETLRSAHPERFNDPILGDSENITAIHSTKADS
jgi:hypothetical protein